MSHANITPVVLITMLEIYAYTDGPTCRDAPAVRAAIQYLLEEHLIEVRFDLNLNPNLLSMHKYRATERGRRWVRELTNLPPVEDIVWIRADVFPPPEPGWYPCAAADRLDKNVLRWWDGHSWSRAARPHVTAEVAAEHARYLAGPSIQYLRWSMPWWGIQSKCFSVEDVARWFNVPPSAITGG